MTTIKVPRPPSSAMDKNRPISSLLKTQVQHLQEAEFRLPANAQTNVYINAIRTEGQAADYIRQVTARLREQHAIAIPKAPGEMKPKRAPSLEIAAVAITKSAPRGSRKQVKKSSKRRRRTTTKGRKKK